MILGGMLGISTEKLVNKDRKVGPHTIVESFSKMAISISRSIRKVSDELGNDQVNNSAINLFIWSATLTVIFMLGIGRVIAPFITG